MQKVTSTTNLSSTLDKKIDYMSIELIAFFGRLFCTITFEKQLLFAKLHLFASSEVQFESLFSSKSFIRIRYQGLQSSELRCFIDFNHNTFIIKSFLSRPVHQLVSTMIF